MAGGVGVIRKASYVVGCVVEEFTRLADSLVFPFSISIRRYERSTSSSFYSYILTRFSRSQTSPFFVHQFLHLTSHKTTRVSEFPTTMDLVEHLRCLDSVVGGVLPFPDTQNGDALKSQIHSHRDHTSA